ncbi:MAG TPA: glycosyltransferase [Vicinamibacterales bacterium]|nr:glycosyltransferase [Vicinamibacterales bacterium]
MRILLADSSAYAPVTPLFLEAVEELSRERGYDWKFFDEGRFGPSPALISRALGRLTGHRFLRLRLNASLLATARCFRPDLVLIVKGGWYEPHVLKRLKEETGALLVNYATDDPFNGRVNSPALVRSIPLYDFYACTKRAIVDDVCSAGCGRAAYVRFAYKPSVHYPEDPATSSERERFDADVAFIGTGDDERIPVFERLLRSMPSLKLKIYGGGWWRRHPLLKRHHAGFAIGRDFRLAARGARIVVNLVRQANRDGHVQRSFELPACGAFVVSDRTAEHLECFREGEEMAFFSNEEELVDKIRYYTVRSGERERIARQGYLRVTRGEETYTTRLRQILAMAAELPC